MNPADHAAHLRQTAEMMEQSARALERVEELESKIKAHDADWDAVCITACGATEILHQTRFSKILDRIHDLLRENEGLRRENQSFQGKLVTNGNYDVCRYNVLNDIYRVLGSDGLPMEIDVLTGVQSHLNRLPKRIEQLLADVTTWRERYDKEVCKNGDLVRENETLARNVPPVPPEDEQAPRYVGDLCEAWMNRGRVDGCCNPSINPDRMNDAPEPPAEVAAKLDLVYVGQRWCRSGRTAPDDAVVLRYPDGWVVLCESWMDRETGKLTDIPVPVRDLPEVSAL